MRSCTIIVPVSTILLQEDSLSPLSPAGFFFAFFGRKTFLGKTASLIYVIAASYCPRILGPSAVHAPDMRDASQVCGPRGGTPFPFFARLLARTWVLPAPNAGIFLHDLHQVERSTPVRMHRKRQKSSAGLEGPQLSTMMKFPRLLFHHQWQTCPTE
jgi:hypothetical protein